MLWMLDREPDQPRAAFHPVVDLASGLTVGWELLPSPGDVGPQEVPRASGGTRTPLTETVERDSIGLLLATRPELPTGHFVVLRISGRALADPAARALLRRADRLDGVILVVRGPMARDSLMLLEEARERGALVGCDTAVALIHFTALAPDLLSVPELLVALDGAHTSARGVVAVLAVLAATAEARVLAHGVASAAKPKELAGLGVALAQGPAFGRPEPYIPEEGGKVSSAFFGRRGRAGAGRLARSCPTLPAAEPVSAILDACLNDDEHDWLVLVDEGAQPVRLVERAALLRGDPFEHRVVAVHPAMSLEAVAMTALDRAPGDLSRPLVVCDAAGRYRGLLMGESTPARIGAR